MTEGGGERRSDMFELERARARCLSPRLFARARTSSGCVYSFDSSTSELSTPSSSPPVTPSSISSMQSNLLMRSRYSLHVATFSSSGSSERSSMCDEKSGSPFFLK